jgi:Lipopolysaccharide-assembly
MTKYISLCLVLLLMGCYSFTGSSLSPDVKTIQIKPFGNSAALVNPRLTQEFYLDIQNRFLQRTNLKEVKSLPDIMMEGEIVEYNISPTTIATNVGGNANQVPAAQNKLTIAVKINYENKVEPIKNFNRTFSDEVVFDSSLSLPEIENSQVKVVNERIINKIFNDIVANW